VVLKKVVLQDKPQPAASHLDLIRKRQWSLRKVDTSVPRPALPARHEEKPADQLSLQEILQKAAAMREHIAVSDSASSSSGSTSTNW
jgi:hypothetical protein